ncbi:MAG: hypothetical protein L3J24_03000 [Xanthomonadales bacterium]|nr:hypothetical protein [Xanthomonadales bacterium]MCF6262543.1 hypothetical protein [Xanthomonadales bacterium]
MITLTIVWRTPVFVTEDMNPGCSPETRRKPIHGGSSPASMRVEVSGEHPEFMLEQLTGQQ